MRKHDKPTQTNEGLLLVRRGTRIHTHTKPKLINRVGSANEEEELKQRIKGTNKHVGVISYGGYELTHLERS